MEAKVEVHGLADADFVQIGTEIGKLVAEKNAAYGDAFAQSGAILRILYPRGARPDQFEDLLGVCRVVDKLFRIATRKDAFGESPWRDIGGYGLLGVARDKQTRRPGETQVIGSAVHNGTVLDRVEIPR